LVTNLLIIFKILGDIKTSFRFKVKLELRNNSLFQSAILA